MKNILKFILKTFMYLLIFALILTGVDYYQMKQGNLPVFNLSFYNSKNKTQYFDSIFYHARRTVKVSTSETLEDSSDIVFRFLLWDFKIDLRPQKISRDFLIETKEGLKCNEKAKLYYKNDSIKVYTFCLDDIQIQKDGTKKDLSSFLEQDSSFMNNIIEMLGYAGVLQDGTTLEFQSREDDFTNNGLRIYQCQNLKIPSIYIGPKNMVFQSDFCLEEEQ